MGVNIELVVKFQVSSLWSQAFNLTLAKGHCEEAEDEEDDEGVCPSVSSAPSQMSVGDSVGVGAADQDQVLFSLDRIYIDSFPRRPPIELAAKVA